MGCGWKEVVVDRKGGVSTGGERWNPRAQSGGGC